MEEPDNNKSSVKTERETSAGGKIYTWHPTFVPSNRLRRKTHGSRLEVTNTQDSVEGVEGSLDSWRISHSLLKMQDDQPV